MQPWPHYVPHTVSIHWPQQQKAVWIHTCNNSLSPQLDALARELQKRKWHLASLRCVSTWWPRVVILMWNNFMFIPSFCPVSYICLYIWFSAIQGFSLWLTNVEIIMPHNKVSILILTLFSFFVSETVYFIGSERIKTTTYDTFHVLFRFPSECNKTDEQLTGAINKINGGEGFFFHSMRLQSKFENFKHYIYII